MTTFEAVTAHWPKQVRVKSTQRSRKSVKTSPMKPSSPGGPSSPVKAEMSSPTINGSNGHTQPDLPHAADIDGEAEESEEEDNPFELMVMTQRIPDDIIEVNPSFIQRNLAPAADAEEDDDPDRFQRLHEQGAAKHAEESARFRATQVPKRDQEEMSEYDDEELDELFRQTVNGGFSTPTKNRTKGSTSVTPTTVGSSGSLTARRERRDQRLREQAGLGDLRYDPCLASVIMADDQHHHGSLVHVDLALSSLQLKRPHTDEAASAQ